MFIFLSVSEIYSTSDSLYGDMITLTCQTIEIPLRSTTIMNIDWSQANGAPIDSESGAVIDPQEHIDGVYRKKSSVQVSEAYPGWNVCVPSTPWSGELQQSVYREK